MCEKYHCYLPPFCHFTPEEWQNIGHEYDEDRTGTLWEYISPTASCNHGFASYVIYWMDKLGLIFKTKGETLC